ncbi:MAG TPA: DUF3883 domain-containing protein, partial [Verrucomicrobiae bacterium]|nr:DUF3883 domain-containing protein [Verrucomicrobiae bacterium]
CGFDYQLVSDKPENFLAIEVKGLRERSGSIMLTEKEHKVAEVLKERFFLFIVFNFREKPFHRIFNKPLVGPLKFSKKERLVKEITWSAAC